MGWSGWDQQMEDSTLGGGGGVMKVLLSSRVPCEGAAIVAALLFQGLCHCLSATVTHFDAPRGGRRGQRRPSRPHRTEDLVTLKLAFWGGMSSSPTQTRSP